MIEPVQKKSEPIPTIPVNIEVPIPTITSREHLYNVAVSCLGIDASPNDLAPDEYGCAETVWNILNKAFSDLNFPVTLSTATLYRDLLTNPKRFYLITLNNAEFGDIILCPTGYNTHPDIMPNGHVGIVAKHGIMSNDSYTGKFMENYTIDSWIARYVKTGGYPIFVFRCV